MAVHPEIALQVQNRPLVDPQATIGHLMQQRDMAAQIEQRYAQAEQERQNAQKIQAENDQNLRDVADQNTIKGILGDPTLAPKLMGGDVSVLHGKVQPKAVEGFTKFLDTHQKEQLTNTKTQNELAATNLAKIEDATLGIKSLPVEDRPAAYQQVLATLNQQKAFDGLPQGNIPKYITGDDKEIDQMLAGIGALKAVKDKALEMQTHEQTLATAKQKAEHDAEMAPLEVVGKEFENTEKAQKILGTTPITLDQQAQLDIQKTSADRAAAAQAETARHNRVTESHDATVDQGNKLLTPAEAAMLGVPYGTTREGAKGAQPATEAQKVTANYASRLKQSNDILADISHQSTGMLVEGKLPDFANFLKSDQTQSFEQAKRNFINSVLRRESGAVISPSEFAEGNRQYFPQAGDSEKVLQQKAENRATVLRNFKKAAGNAYEDPVSLKEAAGTTTPAASSSGWSVKVVK